MTEMRFLLVRQRHYLFKINEGKLDPVLAVTLGKLKVEGNIDKALYLKKLIDSRKAEQNTIKKTQKQK